MGAIDSLVGAFLIGTLINYGLWGITWMQTITYFQTLKESERMIYKVAVVALFLLGGAHTAVSAATMYESTVTGFGNFKNLDFIPFGFCLDPILTAVIALIVEIFYSHRIYVISGRKPLLPILILLLGLTQLAFGFFCTIYAFMHPSFGHISDITFAVASWLVLMAVADVLITSILYYFLSRARYSDGYKPTNDVIEKVIRLVVATNLLTAVTAVTSALFFAFGAGAWHVIAGLNISKFYQISLMTSLNSREQLEKDIQGARSFAQQNPKPTMADALSQIQINLPDRSARSAGSRHTIPLRRGSYTGSTKDHSHSLDQPITVTVESEITDFRVEEWDDRHNKVDMHVGDVNGLLPVPTDKPFQE